MKKFLVAQWVLVILAVGVGLHLAPAPSAEAGLFFNRQRRIFPIFRRPLFNRRPGLLFNRNVRRINNNNNVVRNVNINFNNVERIQGFARLAQAGGVIVEEDRAGNFNRLIVDGFGRLLVQRRFGNRFAGPFQLAGAETTANLVDFYLKNIDNFGGRFPAAVDRFLAANVRNSGAFGQLTAAVRDLGVKSMGVRPTDKAYDRFTDEQIRSAALAWLLNGLSGSCNKLPITPGDVDAAGNITKNLDGFYDRRRLALLLNNNPYSCGDPRAPVRVDWLVHHALTPEVYYPVQGLENTFDEFAQQVGMQPEQRNTRDLLNREITRMVVSTPRDPQSDRIVGANPTRVLEIQSRANAPGQSVYRSYDFLKSVDSGPETFSRDPIAQGIGFRFDAGEFLYTKCNDFMGAYLSDFKGARFRDAPCTIARRQADEPEVVAPESCYSCHANGFIGGRTSKLGKNGKEYDRTWFAKMQPLDGGFHTQFFASNGEHPNDAYEARAIADSVRFNDAKKAVGAHLAADPNDPNGPSMPVLYDLSRAYRKNVSLDQAAKELGVPNNEAFRRALGLNIYEIGPDKEKQLVREDFERNYCAIKRSLAANPGAPPSSGGQPAGDTSNHGAAVGGENIPRPAADN